MSNKIYLVSRKAHYILYILTLLSFTLLLYTIIYIIINNRDFGKNDAFFAHLKTLIGIAVLAMPKNCNIHQQPDEAPGAYRTPPPRRLFTHTTPSSYPPERARVYNSTNAPARSPPNAQRQGNARGTLNTERQRHR